MDKKKFVDYCAFIGWGLLCMLVKALAINGLILIITGLLVSFVLGLTKVVFVWIAVGFILFAVFFPVARWLDRPLPSKKDLEELEKIKKSWKEQ